MMYENDDMERSDDFSMGYEGSEKSHKPKIKAIIKGILIFLGGAMVGGIITAVVVVWLIVEIMGGNINLNYSASEKMGIIRNYIDNKFLYIDSISENTIEDGIYRGIMNSLGDPYSVYYDAKEYNDIIESSNGYFYGVGVYMSQSPEDMKININGVIPESPAEKVGIKEGDVLIRVDGEDISGLDLVTVVTKVKGVKGTSVNLTFMRDGSEVEFDVERDEVKTITVTTEMVTDDIGSLRLSEFDDVSAEQFKNGVEDLKSKGMKKLIVDLRSNGGGNVDTALNIADMFLSDKMVFYTEDNKGSREDYSATENVLFDLPMVVLTDTYTASASEILVGALRDYGKCTIIGEKTFGKGIIQNVIPLGDSSAIKLTVMRYYTPSGNCIHEKGINPDILVRFDYDAYKEDKTDNQIKAAIEYLDSGKVTYGSADSENSAEADSVSGNVSKNSTESTNEE